MNLFSYDPKGNKAEYLLRRNGDPRIFVWLSHKEYGDAHVWHSHKDNGDTQDIYVIFTFTQRKVRKSCGSPYKVNKMYEIKGNKEVSS